MEALVWVVVIGLTIAFVAQFEYRLRVWKLIRWFFRRVK